MVLGREQDSVTGRLHPESEHRRRSRPVGKTGGSDVILRSVSLLDLHCGCGQLMYV